MGTEGHALYGCEIAGIASGRYLGTEDGRGKVHVLDFGFDGSLQLLSTLQKPLWLVMVLSALESCSSRLQTRALILVVP